MTEPIHTAMQKTCYECGNPLLEWELASERGHTIAKTTCCGHYYQIRERMANISQNQQENDFNVLIGLAVVLTMGYLIGNNIKTE